MSEVIHTGIVKAVFNKRGFGFITNSETKADIFFHATGCVAPEFNGLSEGVEVNYSESTRNERPIAIEIVEI